MKKPAHFTVLNAWLPPLLYAGMIFLLSSRNYQNIHLEHQTDKLVHLLLYGGLGYCLLRGYRKDGRWARPRLWTILLVVLYGISDEFHQSFVPGRDTEFMDVVFDGLGGLLALCVTTAADRFGWRIWL
jgi:VanZ family protein